MASLRPHRRQWVISALPKHPELERLRFGTRRLGPDIFLHHDGELQVEDRDGDLVLGRMIRDLDGRYVTISDGRLSLDATGSLGVFYFADGPVRCSSSPVLLALVTQRALKTSGGKDKFSWIPAPGSPVEGARRLLIDEVLDLRTGSVSVQSRTLTERGSAAERAEILVAECEKIVKAIADTGRPVYLALTGGQDSRTAFSALVKAGVPFTAFTMVLSDGNSKRDVRVAKQLCKSYGVPHIAVRARAWGAKARGRLYKAHSGGTDGDRGGMYAAGDYYRHIPDGAFVIHGGTLGLSKNKDAYYDIFDGVDEASADAVIDRLQGYYGPLNAEKRSRLREWHDHRRRHPISDTADHFFLDQRRACWGANNRFAEDVFGFEWLLFANSWRLVDVFMSAPFEARANLLVQKMAIDIMTPGLNSKMPEVNPAMTFMEQMQGRLSRRGLQKAMQRIKRALNISI